jgi:hypothetical protein
MNMITIDRALVEQALETIEGLTRDRLFTAEWARVHGATIAALRTALAQPAPEPCEPLEVLKRALEIIAVGDSKNPQQDAADALVDIGFWSGEGSAR